MLKTWHSETKVNQVRVVIYTFAIIVEEKDKQCGILSLTSNTLASQSAIFKQIEFTKDKRYLK